MSRIIANSFRNTGASADAITLDSSGNATFPANVTCSGTATGFGGGKVLQYVNATYSTSVVVNGADWTDSGLSATITPASGTKILVLVMMRVEAYTQNNDSNGRFGLRLVRDSTNIYGNFTQGLGLSIQHGGVGYYPNQNYSYLDTHGANGSTAVTYKIQGRPHVQSTGYVLNMQTGNNLSMMTLLELE
tara:strand:- start:221 stop:787 length:567 start_codon:yes stop_codon:yes gene_type:complete